VERLHLYDPGFGVAILLPAVAAPPFENSRNSCPCLEHSSGEAFDNVANADGRAPDPMLSLIEILVAAMSVAALLISGVLALEIAAAVPFRIVRPDRTVPRRVSTVAVLVPAHNEALGIAATLASVRRQMRADDKLLVVADNCSDATAEVARAQGAEVAERTDPEHRGKGHALHFGIERLRLHAPDIVVILDADCILGPGALDLLAAEAAASGRPVQALYLISAAPDAPLQQKVSAFAFRLKNLVRYAGLKRLALPCPLAGTGMAFPWPVICDAPLATGNIVEDMKLGIDLAVAGHPAVFEPRAEVTSRFPSTEQGQTAQRRRWEHGHLATILAEAPRLAREAFRQRRADLFGMALDLTIPPLSFFILALAALVILAAGLQFWGAQGIALALSASAAGLAGLSLLAAWYVFGRDLLSAGDLAAIPCYVARKIPLYVSAFYARERQWVRSSRRNGDGGC
jgi:cellulose synthase/poly-beta-1,6-N-acetylglucosamine synthase-like glycosyltransferase